MQQSVACLVTANCFDHLRSEILQDYRIDPNVGQSCGSVASGSDSVPKLQVYSAVSDWVPNDFKRFESLV